MTKDKWHGHIAIFAANILFGINIPIAKTLMPEWIDPVGLTFLRMSFGALAFWAVSLFTLNEKVSKKDLLNSEVANYIQDSYFNKNTNTPILTIKLENIDKLGSTIL